VEGKSLLFLLVLLLGYIFGIINKVVNKIDYVMYFYILNLVLVAADTGIYFRNLRKQ
jgi:hypothetical protein